MGDSPPRLGSKGRSSTGGSDSFRNARDSVVNGELPPGSRASQAYYTVADHPATKSMKETVNNAPVAQAAKNQANKASYEFESLRASRQTPEETTATGQNLTHYHSFFYDLLSWEHPRASGIAFGVTVFSIFAARYMPILPLIFKTTAWVLGTVALAEGVGKLVLSQSLLSSVRPKRYYTIPRESLEAALEDVEQLINFFVIEFQRILFAENVLVTFATFVAALFGYVLIKFTPFWGLCLMSVSTLFLGPLIYRTNQELIDAQLKQAGDLINAQANQVKDLAGQHTSRASEKLRTYTSEYTAKAQEMLGNAKRQATPANGGKMKSGDFPKAPNSPPANVKNATSPKAKRTAQAA